MPPGHLLLDSVDIMPFSPQGSFRKLDEYMRIVINIDYLMGLGQF